MDLLKILLIGGAAYYLYIKGYLSQLGLTPGTGTDTHDTTNKNVNTGGTSTQTNITILSVRDKILSYVKAHNPELFGTGATEPMMTLDQWNYMYAAVTGIPGPAWEDIFPGANPTYRGTPIDRNSTMTIEGYVEILGSSPVRGFTGLGRRDGGSLFGERASVRWLQ